MVLRARSAIWASTRRSPTASSTADPVAVHAYVADTSRPGIDDGHIRSIAGRVVGAAQPKDKISYYHDEQDKVRGHWGIAVNVPPEAVGDPGDADQLRLGDRNGRGRRRNKLLFDAGFARLRPGIPGELSAGGLRRRAAARARSATAAPARSPARGTTRPITSRSCSPSSSRANYVTGSHSLRVRRDDQPGASGGSTQQSPATSQPVTYNAGVPVSVDAAHSDRSPQLDQERQRRVRAGQVDDQAARRSTPASRWDWFISATDPGNAAGQHLEPRRHLQRSAPTASTT